MTVVCRPVHPAIFLVLTVGFLLSAPPLFAIEGYSELTGEECSVCHLSESGGSLTAAGEAYAEDAQNWSPPSERVKKSGPASRIFRILVLYLHIFFGIIWVGTILYVHLVLKPQYALGGLPKSELRLAWLSMPIIAVTGILLTLYRLKTVPGVFDTVFGKLLFGKIIIFSLMMCSATFVTLFIGPRLRKMAEALARGDREEGKFEYTPDDLRGFNGEGGQKSLVAVNGEIWDFSSSRMWKNGLHAGRHKAGRDMTGYLEQAPHGLDVLKGFEKVGRLLPEARTSMVVRIFTINAHFNLTGVFLIILILALWRW